MDIVNWLYLKKAELIRDAISNPEDLVLLGADVSFDKRGDKYLTYAVPVSLLGGGGSSITLQTNGTDNTVQTTLNLVDGNNIELTDNGDGSVTIATAGDELVDADNGLKIGAPGIAYLGGTLLETTTIDVTDQYQLNIIGQNDQPKGEIVFIENSSLTEDIVSLGVNCDNGIAISATSTIGIAIDALSESGPGITGTSKESYGIVAISASVDPLLESRPIYAYGTGSSKPSLLLVTSPTAGADATKTPALVLRKAGNSPLPGNGPLLQFETKDTGNTILVSSTIASAYTDVTLGSESTALEFSALDGGTINKVLVMEGSGIFTLTQGLGDHLDDAAAAAAGVPINGLYRTASNVKIRVI